MAVDDVFSVPPPTSVPSSGLDLAKIASGRVVEARVASLVDGIVVVAGRHGTLQLDPSAFGTTLPAVGDTVRLQVRAVEGGGRPEVTVVATAAGVAEETAAAVRPAQDPAEILAQAVRSAAATQTGLAPLFASLAGLAGAPQGSVPEAVRAVVAQLMGTRLAADRPPDAETVRRAFLGSGLFLESRLAARPLAGTAPGEDLKAGLFALRAALQSWVGAPATAAAGPATVTKSDAAAGEAAPPTTASGDTARSARESGPTSEPTARAALGRSVLAAYGSPSGAAGSRGLPPATPGSSATAASAAVTSPSVAAPAAAAGAASPPGLAAGAVASATVPVAAAPATAPVPAAPGAAAAGAVPPVAPGEPVIAPVPVPTGGSAPAPASAGQVGAAIPAPPGAAAAPVPSSATAAPPPLPAATGPIPSPVTPTGAAPAQAPAVTLAPAAGGTAAPVVPIAATGATMVSAAGTVATEIAAMVEATAPAGSTSPMAGIASAAGPSAPALGGPVGLGAEDAVVASPAGGAGAAPAAAGEGEAAVAVLLKAVVRGLEIAGSLTATRPSEAGEAAAALAALGPERELRPPPPRRGQAPRGQAALAAETVGAGGVEGLGRRALERTEGALSRILLEQFATLDRRADDPARPAEAGGRREWTTEIPIATPAGTGVVQMTVERDGGRSRDAATPGAAGWRVSFSLDVEPLGPIHARIGLVGEKLSIGLWAERPDAASRLGDDVGRLQGALEAAAIPVESIHLATGRPAAGEATRTSGRFVDVKL